MGTLLLAILCAIVLPLIGGGLFALLLRELHTRHPLPLGGTIGLRKLQTFIDNDAEYAEGDSPVDSEDAESMDAFAKSQTSAAIPADLTDEKQETSLTDVPPTAGVSVFDGTENVPENLPINDALESMFAGTSSVIPNDFERIIEESAQSDDAVLSGLRSIIDDMDQDDLRELADALPGRKIDFSQEIEAVPETTDSVSPTAKDVLGENFDFGALEEHANQTRQSLQPFELDVHENAVGVVSVSSPFMSAAPQLADFVVPQTILPTFSGDWIQESNSVSESTEGDTSQFCFTEESQPMFVRKKKVAKV